ncbi:MAG: hypothetical protein K6G22_01490 [Lachnospiraceae bacterium]|nr:hypothetical protein [Lachnospiraceae bacterium]
MLHKVAVVSGDRNVNRLISVEYMKERGMTVAWCDCEVPDIVSVSGIVSTYIVLLPAEFDMKLHQICFFLRDLCLEEDKTLYLYGSEEMIAKVREIIPKLFILGMYDSTKVPFKEFVDEIDKDFRELTDPLPNLLMIDDDKEYFKQLSLLIKSDFNTTVTTPCLEDVVRYLVNTDILLINLNMKVSVLDLGVLLEAIERKVKTKNMKLLYITDTRAEQKYVNSIQLNPLICFAKEIPMEKIAFYMRRHYSNHPADTMA